MARNRGWGLSETSNRYGRLIEHVFLERFCPGMTEVPFRRSDIVQAAAELGMVLPKNLGDVIYSFRYRVDLPQRIAELAPEGKE